MRFILLALGTVAMSSFAQEHAALSSLVAIAKEKNPEIIATREMWNVAKVKILQERTWDNPSVFVDYQKMPIDEFNTGKADETMYGITQMIPFPGKLSIKGKLSKLDAERTEWDYKETELRIITKLKTAYAKYYYINKSIEIYNENLELMKNIAAVAEKKYVSGKATQGEVLRTQVEASKMHNMLITMKQEKELAAAELNTIIGNDPDEKMPATEDLLPVYIKNNWNEIRKIIAEKNPQLNKEKINVLMGNWATRYAKTSFLPDFDLTYRKRQMNGDWSGQDLMIGLSLPLWFWKPAYNVRELSYELKASLSGQKNVELMTIYAGKEQFIKLQALERQIELYKTTFLPQAEQSFKVTESLYRSDKEDFLMLLESERAFLDFQLDYYKNISEYHQNRAELEKIAGVELE